jgi:hypothetical protein
MPDGGGAGVSPAVLADAAVASQHAIPSSSGTAAMLPVGTGLALHGIASLLHSPAGADTVSPRCCHQV